MAETHENVGAIFGNNVRRKHAAKVSIFVVMFIVASALPNLIYLGPIRLSPYRLVLLLVFLPLVVGWLSGKCGKKRLPDYLLFAFCSWSSISFFVVHGGQQAIEASGMLFIETMGAYLLARRYVQSPEELAGFVKCLFYVVLVLLPFAIFEALTDRNLPVEIGRMISSTVSITENRPRWGLHRSQGPFDHPILFGVYCGSALAMTYFVFAYGRGLVRKIFACMVVFGCAAMSLSSGPLSAMLVQISLTLWDRVLKNYKKRWRLFGTLFGIMYIIVELGSNRSAIAVLIDKFAFNSYSGFMRLKQWDWGTLSIANNPLFGIGFNEYERAFYMRNTVDMFWIVPPMRHGIPVAIALALTFFVIFWRVSRAKYDDKRMQEYRTGYLITLGGFFITGWMVHYWNATYVLFMFFLGVAGLFYQDETPKKKKTIISGTGTYSSSLSTPAQEENKIG